MSIRPIVAVRREFAEANPEAVMTLYNALRKSWDIWWTKAKKFAEASPGPWRRSRPWFATSPATRPSNRNGRAQAHARDDLPRAFAQGLILGPPDRKTCSPGSRIWSAHRRVDADENAGSRKGAQNA